MAAGGEAVALMRAVPLVVLDNNRPAESLPVGSVFEADRVVRCSAVW